MVVPVGDGQLPAQRGSSRIVDADGLARDGRGSFHCFEQHAVAIDLHGCPGVGYGQLDDEHRGGSTGDDEVVERRIRSRPEAGGVHGEIHRRGRGPRSGAEFQPGTVNLPPDDPGKWCVSRGAYGHLLHAGRVLRHAELRQFGRERDRSNHIGRIDREIHRNACGRRSSRGHQQCGSVLSFHQAGWIHGYTHRVRRAAVITVRASRPCAGVEPIRIRVVYRVVERQAHVRAAHHQELRRRDHALPRRPETKALRIDHRVVIDLGVIKMPDAIVE